MTITVQATYEGGVLKPVQPLPFKEHEKVQVTIQPAGEPAANDDAEGTVRRSYGLLGWTGDIETLRRVANEPDFDPQEGT